MSLEAGKPHTRTAFNPVSIKLLPSGELMGCLVTFMKYRGIVSNEAKTCT